MNYPAQRAYTNPLTGPCPDSFPPSPGPTTAEYFPPVSTSDSAKNHSLAASLIRMRDYLENDISDLARLEDLADQLQSHLEGPRPPSPETASKACHYDATTSGCEALLLVNQVRRRELLRRLDYLLAGTSAP